MFALLWPAMQCTESTTLSGAYDDELQPTLIVHNMRPSRPWQR